MTRGRPTADRLIVLVEQGGRTRLAAASERANCRRVISILICSSARDLRYALPVFSIICHSSRAHNDESLWANERKS